jgi:hypothetical protein
LSKYRIKLDGTTKTQFEIGLNKITLDAGSITFPWTLTLPTGPGQAGQVLQTDGAGITSWAAPDIGDQTPYYLPNNEIFTVRTNKQVLFAEPIEVDGTLVVDGQLIELFDEMGGTGITGPTGPTGPVGPTGPGAVSPLTTKGDIFVYGSSDTRLPVGTDGQILAANSAQSTGLEWIAPSAKAPDIQIFTSSGTWVKPAGAKMVSIILVGGGGGGAGGSKGTTPSTEVVGGGGGGGGAITAVTFIDASILQSGTEPVNELAVTVAAGGAAGAGTSVVGNGGAAGNGGVSQFSQFRAGGGTAGTPGGTAPGGAGGSAGMGQGTAGGTGWSSGSKFGTDSSGAAWVVTPQRANAASSGGGGGGHIVIPPSGPATGISGGRGGNVGGGDGGFVSAAPGGTAGTSGAFINGITGVRTTNWLSTGGGGGGSAWDAVAGNGGQGGFPGGGGGGGGAGAGASSTSGNGGAGGNGVVVIMTYF